MAPSWMSFTSAQPSAPLARLKPTLCKMSLMTVYPYHMPILWFTNVALLPLMAANTDDDAKTHILLASNRWNHGFQRRPLRRQPSAS